MYGLRGGKDRLVNLSEGTIAFNAGKSASANAILRVQFDPAASLCTVTDA